MTLVWTAQAVVVCDDRAAARALSDRLSPWAALNVTHYEWLVYFGACSHWLGALAGVLGDSKRAVEHFEDALARNAALGSRPALAQTCLEFARVLRRDRHNAWLGRAGLLLDQAAGIATELSLEPLQREISALRGSASRRFQRASG